MERVKGDLLRLRASLEVKLSDHGVTGPRADNVIGLKVADQLPIKVTIFGSTSVHRTRSRPTRRVPDKTAETQATQTGARHVGAVDTSASDAIADRFCA